MRRRIDPELTRRARNLRNNPTPAELAIWHRISHYRPAFTRQLVVPPFIIDLACRRARLGIELDGSQHVETVTADARRTAFLERKGWRILRLWNSDVLANPDGAAQYILQEAAECLGGTHPQPLPYREGRRKRRLIAEDGEDVAEALAAEARAKIEGAVPGEVVKLMIADGLSPLGAWRRHRGLSQMALAKKAGLSQVWVARIEAGGGYGSPTTRRKLAAALDAPVWALEDGPNLTS